MSAVEAATARQRPVPGSTGVGAVGHASFCEVADHEEYAASAGSGADAEGCTSAARTVVLSGGRRVAGYLAGRGPGGRVRVVLVEAPTSGDVLTVADVQAFGGFLLTLGGLPSSSGKSAATWAAAAGLTAVEDDSARVGRVVAAVDRAATSVAGRPPWRVAFYRYAASDQQVVVHLGGGAVTAVEAAAVFTTLGAEPGVLSRPYGSGPQADMVGPVESLGVVLQVLVTDLVDPVEDHPSNAEPAGVDPSAKDYSDYDGCGVAVEGGER